MFFGTHIFIGKEFDDNVDAIATSLCNFENNALKYNSLYRVDAIQDDKFSVTRLKPNLDEKLSYKSSRDGFPLSWSPEAYIEIVDLAAYYRTTIFADVIQSGINVDVHHLFIHIPLYKMEYIKVVQTICDSIKSTSLPTVIDFIGYCDDLVRFLEPQFNIQTPASQIIPILHKMREENGMLAPNSHLLVIENKTVDGFPLIATPSENNTIDEKSQIESNALQSFADMIAQLIYLLSSHYNHIFPNTIELNDVSGIGFASLCFNKYQFANYLLNRAILRAMDKESVMQDEVNINKSISIVDNLLKNKTSIFSESLKKGIIKDVSVRCNEIDCNVGTIVDDINKKFKELNNIPDKVSALAVLLSKTDCELFANSAFNVDSLCLYDLYNEPISFFIEADEAKFYKQKNAEDVVNPLQELKEINRKVINSESRIRALEKNIVQLEGQIELSDRVQECFIDDSGFYNFGNKKYQLLPNIKEEPLADTYEAHENVKPSVDLHVNFRPIQNQGQQGSCLSFTLTSIFEYMLRTHNIEECDLSEAFLYYNARNLDSTDDTDVTIDGGSRFHPAIESLMQYGIALERLCPYNDKICSVRPSKEAYDDAENRKLIKALNVNTTLNDFKSALSDGYPIAASFVLFDSFIQAQTTGYVPMPTADEIANLGAIDGDKSKELHTSHAMTIVGYSDQLQMFLVRNSWGDEWGKHGYCYVPYDYIEQAGWINFACIITEVASIKNVSPELRQIPAMTIDNSDLYIRYNIGLISLQQEKANISAYKSKRLGWLNYFERLKDSFLDGNNTDEFISQNVDHLKKEKTELQEKVKNAEQQQDEIKKEYKSELQRKLIVFAVLLILGVLLVWGVNKLLDKVFYLDYNLSYLWLIPIYLVYFVILWINSHQLWKKWREQRDELSSIIDSCNKSIGDLSKRIDEFGFKTFTALQVLKSLTDVKLRLGTLYTNYLSLLNNLRVWYKQFQDASDQFCIESSFPTTTILDKQLLNQFFEQELLTSKDCDLALTKNIERYQISNNYLSKYFENLQQELFDKLLSSDKIANFNISAHMFDNRHQDIALPITRELLCRLERNADIFMQVDTSQRGIVSNNRILLAPNIEDFGNVLSLKMRPNVVSVLADDNNCRLMLVKTATYLYDECIALRSVKPTKVCDTRV